MRIAVVAGCLALACASAADAMMAGAAPDSAAARVDANVPSSAFAGVGAITVGSATYSGVVIAPQFVLTAGHVGSAGAASAMHFVLNLSAIPWTSAIQSVAIYPTYSFPYDDLAVLKLAAPVPAGVPIYPMYSGAVTAGLVITLAGYGSSGNGDVGLTVGSNPNVKRTGANAVDAVQNTLDNTGLSSRFYLYDFDGPSGRGALGGTTLGNATETLVGPGDSGGPAFVASGGSLTLLGIDTFVAPASTGAPTNYEFGMLGGGILASDPRFAQWLHSATEGTLGGAAIDADGPLPVWALGLLAVGLAGVGMIRLGARRERSISP